MVRVHERRVGVVALDPNLELAPLLVRVGLWRLQHSRIELRVLAEDAAVGEPVLPSSLDDEQEQLTVRDEAVRRSFRQHEVVALVERERTVVGLERSPSLVDEVAEVAVGVAEEVRHRLSATGNVKRDLLVGRDRRPLGLRVGHVRRLEAVQVVGGRAERPLDPDPRRRRMRPVKVRGTAGERLSSVLLFIGAVGEADVGLARDLALREREHARACLGATARARSLRTAP
jgi:hypothetical protein